MATNVKAKINLTTRVQVQNDKTNQHLRPSRDGQQWHDKFCCWTGTIELGEWRWRLEAAEEILCGGSTTYTSYGDAIGHGWID
jgi:hypothetical protein